MSDVRIEFEKEAEYIIGNHKFIVNRHFKEDGEDMYSILLKLMKSDIDKQIREKTK